MLLSEVFYFQHETKKFLMDIHINLDSEIKLKLPLITIMALGEICVFTLFVILGEVEHGVTIRQSFIRTALPFLICWFVISPWLGSYKMSTFYSVKQTIWRIPLTWILCGFIAIITRFILTDRPLEMNFVIVSIAVQGLAIIAWRAMFMAITLRFKNNRL
ncbi:MAG: hypothetical protein CL904_04305 [Dehalococcoidia bacterium]|nr:hypothetical protein [Dehalococcoidia bacterium]MQG16075.1 DUF3054 domain-containing protein [SAR202 cluster bacterium]|tara:strand:- start:133513 stop:133992 length:480 start_codon:yes stop_codon:yes gene_type:complete